MKINDYVSLIISEVLMLGVVVTVQEGDWYAVVEPETGVASQGKSCDGALKNFQEAFELWFVNAGEWANERAMKGEPVAQTRKHTKLQEKFKITVLVLCRNHTGKGKD